MKKYVFVLSYVAGPRMNKRIRLMKEYFKVSTIYWKRSEESIWELSERTVDNREIYERANYGMPLKRINATVKFIMKAIKHLKSIQPDFIHVENLDMLFAAVLYKRIYGNKVHIIYEVADIHELLINNYANPIRKIVQMVLKFTEEKMCKLVDLLIITSEKFYKMYYYKLFDEEHHLYMPNMPDLTAFKNYDKKRGGKFTVAFIGWIRYKEQLKSLIKISDKLDINVFIAGSSDDDEIETYASEFSNVTFYGKYDFDTEISKLYSQADCIFSVYSREKKNVDFALPNKLYESIYCALPIIVSKETYLAQVVEEWGVGCAIDCTNIIELENTLEQLKNNEEFYKTIEDNCIKMQEMINIKYYNRKLIDKVKSVEN